MYVERLLKILIDVLKIILKYIDVSLRMILNIVIIHIVLCNLCVTRKCKFDRSLIYKAKRYLKIN